MRVSFDQLNDGRAMTTDSYKNRTTTLSRVIMLCERLDFEHIYNLKKLLFLHKLV